MARTTEQIEAALAVVRDAIASPERQVTLGSQNITYRSIADLKEAEKSLLAELDSANAVGPRRAKRSFGVYMGRGFSE